MITENKKDNIKKLLNNNNITSMDIIKIIDLEKKELQNIFDDFDNNEKGIAISLQYPNLNIDGLIEKIYEVYIKSKRTK